MSRVKAASAGIGQLFVRGFSYPLAIDPRIQDALRSEADLRCALGHVRLGGHKETSQKENPS